MQSKSFAALVQDWNRFLIADANEPTAAGGADVGGQMGWDVIFLMFARLWYLTEYFLSSLRDTSVGGIWTRRNGQFNKNRSKYVWFCKIIFFRFKPADNKL